jgi:hypothetical protein
VSAQLGKLVSIFVLALLCRLATADRVENPSMHAPQGDVPKYGRAEYAEQKPSDIPWEKATRNHPGFPIKIKTKDGKGLSGCGAALVADKSNSDCDRAIVTAGHCGETGLGKGEASGEIELVTPYQTGAASMNNLIRVKTELDPEYAKAAVKNELRDDVALIRLNNQQCRAFKDAPVLPLCKDVPKPGEHFLGISNWKSAKFDAVAKSEGPGEQNVSAKVLGNVFVKGITQGDSGSAMLVEMLGSLFNGGPKYCWGAALSSKPAEEGHPDTFSADPTYSGGGALKWLRTITRAADRIRQMGRYSRLDR